MWSVHGKSNPSVSDECDVTRLSSPFDASKWREDDGRCGSFLSSRRCQFLRLALMNTESVGIRNEIVAHTFSQHFVGRLGYSLRSSRAFLTTWAGYSCRPAVVVAASVDNIGVGSVLRCWDHSNCFVPVQHVVNCCFGQVSPRHHPPPSSLQPIITIGLSLVLVACHTAAASSQRRHQRHRLTSDLPHPSAFRFFTRRTLFYKDWQAGRILLYRHLLQDCLQVR